MDLGSLLGILIGLGGILFGYIEEDGIISKLFKLSSICIVFGGTFGATIVTYPLAELKKLPQALKIVFSKPKNNVIDIINELAALAEKARKDGLLALEQDIEKIENPFIRRGITLVVDGTETELMKDILAREITLHESVYESSAKIFESMGGFAPTMGVLGTVMGMLSILADLGDSESLGPKISGAFIATMYGVGSANVIFLPLAGRIKVKAEKERVINELIIEGLLSIHAGENPKLIKEKLNLSLWEKLDGKGNASEQPQTGVEG